MCVLFPRKLLGVLVEIDHVSDELEDVRDWLVVVDDSLLLERDNKGVIGPFSEVVVRVEVSLGSGVTGGDGEEEVY